MLDKESLYQGAEIESVIASLDFLPAQIEQSWAEVDKISLRFSVKGIENIVVAGMGGSALGGEILKGLEAHLLRKPIEIVRDYSLPGYVDQNSLIILSSYSGATEEITTIAKETLKKTNKIFIFTTGGNLADFAAKHNLSVYDPTPIFNPSDLPRLSLGYSLTTLLSLFNKLSLLKMNSRRLRSLISLLVSYRDRYRPSVPTKGTPAKKLALTLIDRLPVLVGGTHLFGSISAARNMFHETGKTFAVSYPLPELNHHLLESLSFPKDVTRRLTFLLLLSRFDYKAVKQRARITATVLEKRNIAFEPINIIGRTPLEEVYWLIQFFGYVTFYLAILYGVDPGRTPWVDYLKESLKA